MSNRTLLTVAIVSTTLLVVMVGLNVWGLTLGDETPPQEIYSVELECPTGAREYTGLGNGGEWVGWYRTCVQNHGPIYAWRDGKLAIRGSFVNGKRHGDFVSYNQDGKVAEKIKYLDGNLAP